MKPFVLAIDGPSGSGKTTYSALRAEQISSKPESVQVIHLDDLYGGWQDPLGKNLEKILEEKVIPGILSEGNFMLPYFDWITNQWGEERYLPHSNNYIIEGVGAFMPILRPIIDEAVWIECEEQLGFSRALARDGEQIRQQLENFIIDQREYFEATFPREFANYSIPTQGI